MLKTPPEEVKQLLAHLARRTETWKTDHDGAMLCRDAEATAALAIAVFLAIDVIDMNRRAAVLAGREPFDPAEDDIIEGLYREWTDSAGHVAAMIDAAEADGFDVNFSEPFRRANREAQAMFVPDSQYFSGQALTDLRDRAIDDHRSGLTADLHEFAG